MATSKLSSRARTIISTMLPPGRVIIRDIEPIYPRSVATGLAYERFNEVWTKLRAFDLEEYEKVALVDSDMLVRKNMDELFEDEYVFGGKRKAKGEEWIGASWACTCNPNRIATYPKEWIPENCGFTPQTLPEAASSSTTPQPTQDAPSPSKLINSGLVILTPSSSTMNEMIRVIDTDKRIPHYRFPDQDFLADFFDSSSRHIRYLPYKYNALKKLRLVHTNIWRDEDATNIHYILDKPWSLGRPGGKSNAEGKDPDAEVHSWWWSTFDQVKVGLGEAKKGGNALRLDAKDWTECVEKYMNLE